MRIAILAPLGSPLLTTETHGSHAIVVDVARGLAERGHAVLVICAEGSNIPDLPLATIPVRRGWRTRLVPGTGPRVLAAPMRDAYERAVAAVRQHQPDAVSAHAFDPDAISLVDDLPTMHTLHRAPTIEPVIEALRGARASLFAVSETSGRDWALADVGPIGVVPIGVPDLVRWPRATGPRHATEPDAVLIPGRIEPERGTATAVRAAQAAGLRPIVVGTIEDESYFRSEVGPLLGRGVAVRPVTRPALAALMGRVAATLLPIALDEPFSLLAAEAQVAGCPVVAWRRSALPEIVDEDVAGVLVEPGDEPGLVEALRSVRGVDRRAIRAQALERFAVDAMVDAYDVELRGIAEAARTGAARPTPVRLVG